MSHSELEEELARRFGAGRFARQAVRQALQERRKHNKNDSTASTALSGSQHTDEADCSSTVYDRPLVHHEDISVASSREDIDSQEPDSVDDPSGTAYWEYLDDEAFSQNDYTKHCGAQGGEGGGQSSSGTETSSPLVSNIGRHGKQHFHSMHQYSSASEDSQTEETQSREVDSQLGEPISSQWLQIPGLDVKGIPFKHPRALGPHRAHGSTVNHEGNEALELSSALNACALSSSHGGQGTMEPIEMWGPVRGIVSSVRDPTDDRYPPESVGQLAQTLDSITQEEVSRMQEEHQLQTRESEDIANSTSPRSSTAPRQTEVSNQDRDMGKVVDTVSPHASTGLSPCPLPKSPTSDQFYARYRVRQHRVSAPDFKFSQPGSQGPQVALKPLVFSFDEAHPALASQHYLRSAEQNQMLVDAEKQRATKERIKVARHGANSRVARPQRASPQGQGSPRVKVQPTNPMTVPGGGPRRHPSVAVPTDVQQQAERAHAQARQALANSARLSAAHDRSLRAVAPHLPERYKWAAARALGGGSEAVEQHLRASDDPGVPAARVPRCLEEGGGREVSTSQERPEEDYQVVELVNHLQGRVKSAEFNAPPTCGPSLADHLAWASNRNRQGGAGHRLPEGGDGTSDDMSHQQELMVALGTFNENRFGEYNRQVDEAMSMRAARGYQVGNIEDGYTSDIEREEEVDQELQRKNKAVEALKDAEERIRRQLEEEVALKATWEQQNEWMDYYRTRSQMQSSREQRSPAEEAEVTGAEKSERLPRKPQSDTRGDLDRQQALGQCDQPAPAASAPAPTCHSVLSPADEELLQRPFIPILSDEFSQYAASEGIGGEDRSPLIQSRSAPGCLSDGPFYMAPLRKKRRPFRPTTPQPFTFEERAARRGRSISQVKFEQDVKLRQQELQALYNNRFKAKPLPRSTTEPRYERLVNEQRSRRAALHEQRLDLLQSMEQPFSFYYRDKQRQEMWEEAARQARDPMRFQVKFKANEIPSHVKEERFSMMRVQEEAKRVSMRAMRDMTREKVRQRQEELAKQRREAARKAYQERLKQSYAGSCSSEGHSSSSPTKPISRVRDVPDFQLLHATFEKQQAQIRAANRQRLTIPKEFQINGGTPDERAARERKMMERQQRIHAEIVKDQEQLKEMRWPYLSPRKKVEPAPPPVFQPPDVPIRDTLSTRLRSQEAVMSQKLRNSKKDRGNLLHKEVEERARHYVRQQQEQYRRSQSQDQESPEVVVTITKMNRGGRVKEAPSAPPPPPPPIRPLSPLGSSTHRRRHELMDRTDNPIMHIEARHQQIERQVKDMVGDVLLQQGIDIYRFVEQ